ncbi:energy transducer TonB family protein [Candidatus Sulfurimonas baltica]|uniref:Energy transducer TonB n=1 Tax=Candidatus Sulfurimonas baltica TaxID=2740404 RepID=A0A7S7LXA5_9BACT|nr:energy transducer TonB [Candidatus Sulfurimonas baltica]QOY53095.1 energy transducer TonB [Candidatus Sulfurimonas baltica]
MNRSSFALFVALLIHFLLILLFWLLGSITPEVKKPIKEKEEQRMKVSLKEMPKKFKDAGVTKEVIKPPNIAPPMPKGKQLKEIVKPINQQPILYDQKKIQEQPEIKKQPINPPKEEPEEEVKHTNKTEPLPPKEKHVVLEPKKEPVKEEKKDPLAWMYEDKSEQEVKMKKTVVQNSSSIDQNIKELYGEEFGKLTPGQQQYIIDNQEIMRRITQQVLTRVASVNLPRDINVNRTNIIEFYLHPNGDISDFRFLQKSGYFVLDNTTKETIDYAYSKYPRPSEKTLIRYNVFYNLARY